MKGKLWVFIQCGVFLSLNTVFAHLQEQEVENLKEWTIEELNKKIDPELLQDFNAAPDGKAKMIVYFSNRLLKEGRTMADINPDSESRMMMTPDINPDAEAIVNIDGISNIHTNNERTFTTTSDPRPQKKVREFLKAEQIRRSQNQSQGEGQEVETDTERENNKDKPLTFRSLRKSSTMIIRNGDLQLAHDLAKFEQVYFINAARKGRRKMRIKIRDHHHNHIHNQNQYSEPESNAVENVEPIK